MNKSLAELTALRDIESRLAALIRKTAQDALAKLKESERRLDKIHAFSKFVQETLEPNSVAWIHMDNVIRLSAPEARDDSA